MQDPDLKGSLGGSTLRAFDSSSPSVLLIGTFHLLLVERALLPAPTRVSEMFITLPHLHFSGNTIGYLGVRLFSGPSDATLLFPSSPFVDTYVNGGLSLLTCNLEFVRKLAPNFILNVSMDFDFIII